MASCPTAMKVEVDGYIVITLAPTYCNVRICSRPGTAGANLGTERKVTKHSDDFVNANSRADRCAYDDIHTALSVVD